MFGERLRAVGVACVCMSRIRKRATLTRRCLRPKPLVTQQSHRKDVAALDSSKIRIKVLKYVCSVVESAKRNDSLIPAKIW
jgi:hypothetical protein